jgi:microcystin-dependent protein
MSQPYVGEIRIFGGNFAPAGWAFCDGQLMSIAENEVLFQLIGTTYGGDGQETFAAPDLRGRVPMHMGTGSDGVTYIEGQSAGVETVTLTPNQMPQHTHALLVSGAAGNVSTPVGQYLASQGPAGSTQVFAYVPYTGTTQVALNPATFMPAGGSQPHENMQPYLGLNFIISLYGIFPHQ